MKKLLHMHYYDIQFIGDGLNYRLVCSCGDTAGSMEEALWKMRLSSTRVLILLVCGITAIAALALSAPVLWWS